VEEIKMVKPMEIAVDDLIKEIKNNYKEWYQSINTNKQYQKEAITKFNSGISIKVGSKYTKIIADTYVWGFIVNENDSVKSTTSESYFVRGDLLKPSSRSAPARNFSRGNIRYGKNRQQPEYPDYRSIWTSAI
jgi:hypothetical protein